jgi:hypothetical protein
MEIIPGEAQRKIFFCEAEAQIFSQIVYGKLGCVQDSVVAKYQLGLRG